jgi:hypothetical protein
MLDKETTTQMLDRECTIFSNYLIRQSPTPYVLSKYRQAHRTNARLRQVQAGPFDLLLLELSRIHLTTTRVVDVYATLLFRNSLVRKKMVLLLAILESCAPTFTLFDETDPGGASLFALRFLRDALFFALAAAVALVILLPLHLGFDVGALISQSRISFQTRLRQLRSELPTSPRATAPRNEMPRDLPPVR